MYFDKTQLKLAKNKEKIMNKKGFFCVFGCALIICLSQLGCGQQMAGDDGVSYGYPPQVEMCRVHITFYENYYEGDGYVWDKVNIKNGQANSARVQMTFSGTDMEVLDKTVGGQSDRTFNIYVEETDSVTITVEYKNSNGDWVGCPSNPVDLWL